MSAVKSKGTTSAGRRLHFEIFRFNPLEPDTTPYMQSFEIEEKPYMSLFMALNEIRETRDPSLQFDFACRSAICGSCGMMVNGRPALGCRTLTSDLPEVIHLHPLPVFKLIGDLSVDTGTWFRAMVEKTEGWIHATKASTPTPKKHGWTTTRRPQSTKTTAASSAVAASHPVQPPMSTTSFSARPA
jgi:fumarate reductase iron-sulfur subunit